MSARRAAVALALVGAVCWVLLPLREPAVLGVPLPAATKLTDQQTGPIRYGYRRLCRGFEDEPSCAKWHLIGMDGRRWWIPGENEAAFGSKTVLTRKADALALSRDDRFLAVLKGATLTIHELATGTKHSVTVGKGHVLHGWTSSAAVLTTIRQSDAVPGHLNAGELVEVSPTGKVQRRPIPANLVEDLRLSPDGRTAATSTTAGLALVDPDSGKAISSPAVPGFLAVVDWLDGGKVIVTTRKAPGGFGSLTAYQVLDLANGALHPLPVDDVEAWPGSVRLLLGWIE